MATRHAAIKARRRGDYYFNSVLVTLRASNVGCDVGHDGYCNGKPDAVMKMRNYLMFFWQ
jgi:hypothetical protein